jgi:hypothetical protein
LAGQAWQAVEDGSWLVEQTAADGLIGLRQCWTGACGWLRGHPS